MLLPLPHEVFTPPPTLTAWLPGHDQLDREPAVGRTHANPAGVPLARYSHRAVIGWGAPGFMSSQSGAFSRSESQPLRASPRLEPITAVGYPPCGENNGNGDGASPPERKEEIGQQTEQRKGHPEYLFLHLGQLGRIRT